MLHIQSAYRLIPPECQYKVNGYVRRYIQHFSISLIQLILIKLDLFESLIPMVSKLKIELKERKEQNVQLTMNNLIFLLKYMTQIIADWSDEMVDAISTKSILNKYKQIQCIEIYRR